MTYFIVVLEEESSRLNLISCDTNKELFEKLNHKDFQGVEFVKSIMELSQNKKAILINGVIQLPVKKVEWNILPLTADEYYRSTEKQKLEDS